MSSFPPSLSISLSWYPLLCDPCGNPLISAAVWSPKPKHHLNVSSLVFESISPSYFYTFLIYLIFLCHFLLLGSPTQCTRLAQSEVNTKEHLFANWTCQNIDIASQSNPQKRLIEWITKQMTGHMTILVTWLYQGEKRRCGEVLDWAQCIFAYLEQRCKSHLKNVWNLQLGPLNLTFPLILGSQSWNRRPGGYSRKQVMPHNRVS